MNWKNIFKRKSSTITTNTQASITTNNEAIQKLVDLRLTLIDYMKNLEKSKEKTPVSRATFDLCQTMLRKIR